MYLPTKRSRNRIFFLLKAFQTKTYANDFVAGKIFANRLSYFKKIESRDGQGDRYEGAVMLRRDDLALALQATVAGTREANRIVIPGCEFAAPPVWQPKWVDHVNVFCMYAVHIGGIQSIRSEDLSVIRRKLELPEKFTRLGRYAVVVKDFPEFFRRVETAADLRGYRIRRGLVKYYDPNVGIRLSQSDTNAIFSKRKKYEYQNEYRVAIDTGTMGCEPVTLEVGNLDDIVLRMDTRDINRQLSIELVQRS